MGDFCITSNRRIINTRTRASSFATGYFRFSNKILDYQQLAIKVLKADPELVAEVVAAATPAKGLNGAANRAKADAAAVRRQVAAAAAPPAKAAAARKAAVAGESAAVRQILGCKSERERASERLSSRDRRESHHIVKHYITLHYITLHYIRSTRRFSYHSHAYPPRYLFTSSKADPARMRRLATANPTRCSTAAPPTTSTRPGRLRAQVATPPG